ncbi:hypothetical protein Ancab_004608 [Ancistrocladus abbreviatus]
MADTAITVALQLVGSVIQLVDSVIQFLSDQQQLRGTIDAELTDIRDSLMIMQAYLQDAERTEGGSEMKKAFIERIRGVAHEMEDVLDEFMLHAPHQFSTNNILQAGYEFCHHLKHLGPLNEIHSDIQKILKRMRNLRDDLRSLGRPLQHGATSSGSEEQILPEEDEIIGFEKLKDELFCRLKNEGGRSHRRTISVVGPAGSGKTTLLNSIYRGKEIANHFDCFAWLYFSRNCNICPGIDAEPSIYQDGSNYSSFLRTSLQRKRYIVVLDGVRFEQDYRSIEQALPDDFNGSRIIIITRTHDAAVGCATDHNHIYKMPELNHKDSWHLFCKKAFRFRNGKCPPEMEEVSEQIVIKCEGLPLAITTVGSLLSRKPQLPAEWVKVYNNLATLILEANPGDSVIMRTLLTSYNDLPNNLKTCFLYFSILAEDYSIRCVRLIRLWVAEGFVRGSRNRTLEEVAEGYLNELIGRNLVMVSRRDFNGRITNCRVVNLVRDLLLIRAENENFAAVVTDSAVNCNSGGRIRRLSIHSASTRGLTIIRGFQLDRARTLFMAGLCSVLSPHIGEILQKFRLLKVLDLEDADLDVFPDAIVALTLLRYLSLSGTRVKTIPESIKKLHWLQFLDLKHTLVTLLPKAIYALHNLRHLLVSVRSPRHKRAMFGNMKDAEIFGVIKGLQLLQTLSLIKADRGPIFFRELENLVHLRKLGLVEIPGQFGWHLCASIKNMSNLSSLHLRSKSEGEYLDLDHLDAFPSQLLQRLYLEGCLLKLPTWICNLSSLVKLHLKWSRLIVSPTEFLKDLPNLMVLEMVAAFTGDILIFAAEKFQKLKTLHIEQFENLDQVLVFNGAMPKLEKLTICSCMCLHDLPHQIEDLKCLEELLLYDMPQEFTNKLGSSEHLWKVAHIRVIQSFTFDQANDSWYFKNCS